MSIGLELLKAKLSFGGGPAVSNRFDVVLPSPYFNRTDIFLVESATLPGRSISTSEFTTNRETMKNPYTFIDGEVSMTFILDNRYTMRKAFDRWMNDVLNVETYQLGYKHGNNGDGYAKSITVKQQDKRLLTVYQVELLNAYPISISNIDLSNESENTISKLTVEFAYDKYRPIDTLLDSATDEVRGRLGI